VVLFGVIHDLIIPRNTAGSHGEGVNDRTEGNGAIGFVPNSHNGDLERWRLHSFVHGHLSDVRQVLAKANASWCLRTRLSQRDAFLSG